MVVVSNVEILGKPKYRSIKVRLRDQFNPSDQLKSKESKLPLSYVDLVYMRDPVDKNQASHQDIQMSFKTTYPQTSRMRYSPV